MKKLLTAAIIAVIFLAGCGGDTTTPTPSTTVTSSTTTEVVSGTLVPYVEMPIPGPSSTMYPDDLVIIPGGYAYRGNVQQEGEVNPWPRVEITQASLPAGSVTYRADITTNAGQTRNNLVIFSSESVRTGDHTLDLYAAGVPGGVSLEQSGGAGRPGQVSAWLRIETAAGTPPGDYSFTLALAVDGALAGTLPVNVHVVTEPINTPTAPVTTAN